MMNKCKINVFDVGLGAEVWRSTESGHGDCCGDVTFRPLVFFSSRLHMAAVTGLSASRAPK